MSNRPRDRSGHVTCQLSERDSRVVNVQTIYVYMHISSTQKLHYSIRVYRVHTDIQRSRVLNWFLFVLCRNGSKVRDHESADVTTGRSANQNITLFSNGAWRGMGFAGLYRIDIKRRPARKVVRAEEQKTRRITN